MAAALWKGLPLSEISSQRNPRFSSEHGQVITKYSMKKPLICKYTPPGHFYWILTFSNIKRFLKPLSVTSNRITYLLYGIWKFKNSSLEVTVGSEQCCGSVTFRYRSGSAPLTNGSGSCYFRPWPKRCQQKTGTYYFLKVHLHHKKL